MSYPTETCYNTVTSILDDDDITVHTSNVSSQPQSVCHAVGHIAQVALAGACSDDTPPLSIADSGATQIFVMDGTPVINRRPMTRPLKVALADERIVTSTHMCDIAIDGLPTLLTGHIIPDLSIASLFGIRVLTEVGCEVTFTTTACMFNIGGRLFYAELKTPSPTCGRSR